MPRTSSSRYRFVPALIALIAITLAGTPVFAVKANPKPVTRYQPDGTAIEVRMVGDERIVFNEDKEGHTLVRDAAGWWVYADPSQHRRGPLRETQLRAGKDKVPPGFAKHVRPAIDVKALVPPFEQQDDGSIGELFRSSNQERSSSTGRISTQAASLTPTSVPVLVILVEFSDQKHTKGVNTPFAGEPDYQPMPGAANTSPTWQTLLGDPTVPGGLNHFYKEASYGRMQWDVTVAQRGKGQAGTGTLVNDGWYQNPNTMKYWGADRSQFGSCSHDGGTAIKGLITWAVQQADADVNFALYDKDGNGSISDAELMIFVVHAREGQENYGDGCGTAPEDPNNDHIWSHKWNMATSVAVDGKTIPSGHIYAIEPEFSPIFNYSTNPWTLTEKYFGVGVYAHEAFHTLGATDIYDTGYDAVPGGEWDLMDSGSYNGAKSGTHPAHMGLSLKQDIKMNADTDANSYGYITESEIKEVSAEGVYSLNPTGGSTATGVLGRLKTSDVDEWFILENRAAVGYYEKYLPEHGIIIWHRDRSATVGNNSYPYETAVMRKGWANTSTGLNSSLLGAAFSADDNETSFTATTDPNNKLNSGASSGVKDVRCISAEASVMSFAYGTVPAGTSHVTYGGNAVSGGDGDEWLDSGENATLTVRVTNSACAGAAAASVAVSVSSPDATVGGGSPVSYASVAAGQTVDFNFPVSLTCSNCTTASFNYTVSVGGATSSTGSFVKDANRSYLWFDDADGQAKSGWTSQPSPNFIPSACTTATRHGDWSAVAHPFAPRGNSYRAPVTGGVTYANPDEVWTSPNIAIPAGTSIKELRFSLAAEIPCPNYTRGRLWISTDNGASWTRFDNFYKDAGDLGWEEIRADLSAYAAATQIKFLFGMYTYTCQSGCSATRGMYIDNIGVVVGQTGGSTPGDTQAPTTSITSPANGATVSGVTSVSASASDNTGVTRVDFYLDGALAASDSTAPYSWSWDTTGSANGSHSLTSTAFDAAGNSGSSSTVSVTVSNTTSDTQAPTTAITSPAAGATVSGAVTLAATASDNVGVTRVEFYVDGALVGSDTSSPYSVSWSSTSATNGAHSVQSRAFDAAGNSSSSATVGFTVSNSTGDTTAPVISSISSVKTGKNGSFSIRWSTDEPADSKIVFVSGGSGTFTDAALVTSHSMSFTGRKGTTYTYYIYSADAAGNTAQSALQTHQN
jgi:M6 family metalloprotease-like protein